MRESCERRRHADSKETTRRLGMAAAARLGITPAGLVAEGHRRGLRGQLRRCLSVDQADARGWRGGAADAASAGRPDEADGRAADADPWALGPWGRGIWVPWRRVDGQA